MTGNPLHDWVLDGGWLLLAALAVCMLLTLPIWLRIAEVVRDARA